MHQLVAYGIVLCVYLNCFVISVATCIITMEKNEEHNLDENQNKASSGNAAQESKTPPSSPKLINKVKKSDEDHDQGTKTVSSDDNSLTDDDECSSVTPKTSSGKADNLNHNLKLYSADNISNNLNVTSKFGKNEIIGTKKIETTSNVPPDTLPKNVPLKKGKISRQDSESIHSLYCPSQVAQTFDVANAPVKPADKKDNTLHANTSDEGYSDDDMPSCTTKTFSKTKSLQSSSFDRSDDDFNRKQNKDPIYAKISTDLKYKRDNFSHNTIVPFFVEDDISTPMVGQDDNVFWKWRDSSYVRLPHSPLNLNSGRKYSGEKNWVVIEKQLTRLHKACQQNNLHDDMGTILGSVIQNYKPNAKQISNFGMLGRPELQNDLKATLPLVIDLALQLPRLLSEPLPIAKNGDSKTIYLTRNLCSSLLANAFVCTFPELPSPYRMPDYNFIRLFNDTNTDRCEVKKEKIKCILNYFTILSQQPEDFKNQIVSFERRSILNRANWDNSDKPMCKVDIEPTQKIEEAEGMLQVDFANQYIGGGVLNDGSVQEEIRFCISPELIIGRIFMEAMTDDEAIIITGSQIYSEYTGYSTSFKFAGKYTGDVNAETDNLGRTFTQLAAIDALNFKRHDVDKQFEKNYIDRELHKCYVAFVHGKRIATPVATGNWGCGAFNGNPELKFLIQWIAASHQERPLLQFHKVKDQQQENSIQEITTFMQTNKVQVGQLYKSVIQFHQEMHKYSNSSLFNYVKEKIVGRTGNGLKGAGLFENFRRKF